MEHKSLDELLSETEGTEEVTTEQTEAQPRDEHGKFASKGVDPEPEAPEPDAESPSAELPKEEYTAMRGERERRQKAEREADELRQRLEALEAKIPKEPPAPPPSLWEDEQGWQQHFGGQVAQQAALNARLDMSEMLARRDHEDFDAMKAEFLKIAEANPALAEQAISDPDPWRKAYQIAKNAATMRELGATDVDQMRAKLREEIMAEMAAQQSAAPGAPAIPPSLSTQRNAGARTGPAWSGPPSLSDLLA